MLAQRFSRMNAPVRYAALDPAHEHAIRTWLYLATRAHGLPYSIDDALDPEGMDRHPAYKNKLHQHVENYGNRGDSLLGALRGTLTGDPYALGAAHELLDFMRVPGNREERQGDSPRSQTGFVRDTLRDLHRQATQAMGDPGSLRGYYPENMAHPFVAAATMRGLDQHPDMHSLDPMGYMHSLISGLAHRGGHPMLSHLQQLRGFLQQGHPAAVGHAYDAANAVRRGSDPTHLGNDERGFVIQNPADRGERMDAINAMYGMARTLNKHVMPAIAQVGGG